MKISIDGKTLDNKKLLSMLMFIISVTFCWTTIFYMSPQPLKGLFISTLTIIGLTASQVLWQEALPVHRRDYSLFIIFLISAVVTIYITFP